MTALKIGLTRTLPRLSDWYRMRSKLRESGDIRLLAVQSGAISLNSLNSLNSLLHDITEPLNFTAACPAIAFGEGGCRNKKPTHPLNRKDKKWKKHSHLSSFLWWLRLSQAAAYECKFHKIQDITVELQFLRLLFCKKSSYWLAFLKNGDTLIICWSLLQFFIFT